MKKEIRRAGSHRGKGGTEQLQNYTPYEHRICHFYQSDCSSDLQRGPSWSLVHVL